MAGPFEWLVQRLAKIFGGTRTPKGGREPKALPRSGSRGQSVVLPPPKHPMPERPATVPRDPVIVGIDFGTSSTKVAWRDFSDRDRLPTVLDFGTAADGYSRFGLPSVVALRGRRVLVGTEALSVSAEGQIHSPKVALLKGCSTNRGARAFRPGIVVEELAAALVVAAAIRRARTQIIRASKGDRKLLFNLDVPVSELDGRPAVVERFRRVLDQGIYLAEKLEAGATVAEVEEAWHSRAPAAEMRGDVIPESQAVMEGLSRIGRLERDKIYGVLDVGAGTVDIGIFKIVDLSERRRIPFWAACTHPEGCDDLDLWLLEKLGMQNASLREVRAERVAWLAGRKSKGPVAERLRAGALEEGANWLAGRCRGPYSTVYGEAYKKQKNTDEWLEMQVAVVGGGALIPQLRTRLMESPRPHVTKRIAPVDFSRRLHCRVTGASSRQPSADEIPFLLPAVGLAHVKPELMDVVYPGAVAADPGGVRGPTGDFDYEIAET